jgi:transposase
MDTDGTIIGASKIARDISERKRAAEQKDLLIREMSHRVKNAFAVMGGVVAMGARSAATPETMAREIQARLPAILAKRTDVLSPCMLHLIEGLADDWRRLDERIESLSNEINELACKDSACNRLMSVPGIGPIIASAMVAAIGTGEAFSKGRDFGAWLGLVPKQISTGDRTILGSISKRGNRYLRTLFVQAAWVVLARLGPKGWERYGLKSWIEVAKRRLHHNVLAIALANKLARIAWAVLNKGRAFECVKTDATASRPA